ncbi:putative carboxymethylenebutenolidase [Fusarium oxysporum f. sp. albedinis]|nr:putative carboxymethylenebutenolidase [Fusarium oxysporum f. sp. albedinis]
MHAMPFSCSIGISRTREGEKPGLLHLKPGLPAHPAKAVISVPALRYTFPSQLSCLVRPLASRFRHTKRWYITLVYRDINFS